MSFEKSFELGHSTKKKVVRIGKTALWFSALLIGSAYAFGGKAVDLMSDAADAYIKHEYEDPEE